MDSSVFRKLISVAKVISIVAGILFLISLILLHDYSLLLNSDYMPAMIMGIFSMSVIFILSIFITIMITKVFELFQEEIGYLRNRIIELEKDRK